MDHRVGADGNAGDAAERRTEHEVGYEEGHEDGPESDWDNRTSREATWQNRNVTGESRDTTRSDDGEGDKMQRGSQRAQKRRAENREEPSQDERVSKRMKDEKDTETGGERSDLRAGGMGISDGVSRKRKGTENGNER
jgi:hypothetical protein